MVFAKTHMERISQGMEARKCPPVVPNCLRVVLLNKLGRYSAGTKCTAVELVQSWFCWNALSCQICVIPKYQLWRHKDLFTRLSFAHPNPRWASASPETSEMKFIYKYYNFTFTLRAFSGPYLRTQYVGYGHVDPKTLESTLPSHSKKKMSKIGAVFVELEFLGTCQHIRDFRVRSSAHT